MKKMMLTMVAVIAMTMLSGCATFFTGEQAQINSYRLGRVTTVAYILKKDELKPEHVETVKKVWLTFDMLAETIKGETAPNFNDIIKKELKDRIEPAEYVVACELVDMYWSRLMSKVEVGKYTDEELVKVVLEFHRGIKSALADYGYLGN